MCAYAGTATLVGVPPPGRTLDVDLERDLFGPKVAIAVTHGGDTIPQEDFPFLAQAALDGKLDLARFVTRTIALDEVPDALDALHAPTGVRTVVICSSSCRTTARRSTSAGIDEVAVALDVAVLAADDEDDRLLVERVRELARRRRLGVEEAALAELARLAVDLDPHAAAVDEVQLVLRVVVVLEALVAGRIDERVHAERRHAERASGPCGSRRRRRARRGRRTRGSCGAGTRRLGERQPAEQLGELLVLVRA